MQICHTLDQEDKCNQFDLTTSIQEAQVKVALPEDNSSVCDSDNNSHSEQNNIVSALLDSICPHSNVNKSCQLTIFFPKSNCLATKCGLSTHLPLQTFSVGSTVYHLSQDPSFKQMLMHDTAVKFNIPDLAPALAHYLWQMEKQDNSVYTIGGCHLANTDSSLPFHKLEIWSFLQIQLKDYFHPDIVLSPQKLHASLLSNDWPLGRYDVVLANTDPTMVWPQSRILGEILLQ